MCLILPLLILLLFFILLAYWNFDQYAYQRKRLMGYRNFAPEPFKMKKYNFIIYGPSNSGKTTFIKDFCSLYERVTVFCFDEGE